MARDTREAVISTPLSGKVVLERFDASERLSELFAIHAVVVCDDLEDFFPHLGKPCAIKVSQDGEVVRWYHGLLTEADFIAGAQEGFRFQLVLRPWFYFATRNLDYVIFQDMTAIDVIKKVFDTGAWPDVSYAKLSGTPPSRPYCVQYRESDFTFVSRLMEEEGIYYYFTHEEDRHTLVLANGRASHEESEYASLPFIQNTGAAPRTDNRIWSWNERASTGAEKKVTLRNFDFERPATPREGVFTADGGISTDKAEVYDYPARFLEPDDGKALGQTIIEAVHAERRHYLGESGAMALACGDLIKLTGHPLDRMNQEYLIIGLRYALESQTYRSGGGAADSAIVIEATPAETPWRAPMAHPKPVARGPETAIVSGPAEEVIHTDKYGRVKVRFNWDRSGSDPDKSTCFIRVSHEAAGAGFGTIYLPRIGQEVIVDFLSGDPDRPLITGRVYNASNMPLPTLPAQKTLSGWRTQTIGDAGAYDGAENPPGSEKGHNSFTMDDKGGSELMDVHAQRNRAEWVRLDDDEKVGRDQTKRVGRDRTTGVKRNETFTLDDGDEKHTVTTGKRVTQINQNDELTVDQGDLKTTVSMGAHTTAVSMGNMSIDVSLGNYSLKTDAGGVTVEAIQQIELKCGPSSIVIDPTGVTIKGMMITIQAQAMGEFDGGGMAIVKGAMVMIN